jgi:putative transposon-encoded protein
VLEVSDFAGNTTKIDIPVEYSNETVVVDPPKVKSKYFINQVEKLYFHKENVTVSFPKTLLPRF